MANDELLVDLLLRYEELQQQGQSPGPAEMCRDHPELLEAFVSRARFLEQFGDVS